MHLASLLMTLLVTLGLPSAAFAQGIGVVRVRPKADLALAAPKPLVPNQGQAAAAEAWDTMWNDLKMSGYFKMIQPAGYLEKNGAIEPGTFRFEDWEQIGAAVLVKTRAYGAGDAQCDKGGSRMCIDLALYHVPSQKRISEKRFRGPEGSSRYLGHAIANHVLEIVTGTRGHFGSRLAAVNTRTGNKEVYVLDSDGYGVLPVTRNGAINLSPAWSPDGASIAWTSYKRGNPDLYVKNLATGRTRLLSGARGVNTSPAFSPDGRYVAMSRAVGGDADIYLLDAKTGKQIRQVTKGGGIDVSPGFSPDGSTLVFASERSGGSQVYAMPVGTDGQSARRITFRGGFNVDPVVSPNGDRVAFVSRAPAAASTSWCPTCRAGTSFASPRTCATTKIPRGAPTVATSCSPAPAPARVSCGSARPTVASKRRSPKAAAGANPRGCPALRRSPPGRASSFASRTK